MFCLTCTLVAGKLLCCRCYCLLGFDLRALHGSTRSAEGGACASVAINKHANDPSAVLFSGIIFLVEGFPVTCFPFANEQRPHSLALAGGP
jgi:hypothetical protein